MRASFGEKAIGIRISERAAGLGQTIMLIRWTLEQLYDDAVELVKMWIDSLMDGVRAAGAKVAGPPEDILQSVQV